MRDVTPLHFDVDDRQLRKVAKDMGALDREVHQAFGRALNRTAATMRKMAQKGLKTELDLRNLKALRRRLKTYKYKRQGKSLGGAKIFIGTWGLPVSAFKGRVQDTPGAPSFNGETFPGHFVAKVNKKDRASIFRRKGRKRFPVSEAEMPIHDKAQVYIEDEVFAHFDRIFWHHFSTDLKGRVKLRQAKAAR